MVPWRPFLGGSDTELKGEPRHNCLISSKTSKKLPQLYQECAQEPELHDHRQETRPDPDRREIDISSGDCLLTNTLYRVMRESHETSRDLGRDLFSPESSLLCTRVRSVYTLPGSFV